MARSALPLVLVFVMTFATVPLASATSICSGTFLTMECDADETHAAIHETTTDAIVAAGWLGPSGECVAAGTIPTHEIVCAAGASCALSAGSCTNAECGALFCQVSDSERGQFRVEAGTTTTHPGAWVQTGGSFGSSTTGAGVRDGSPYFCSCTGE